MSGEGGDRRNYFEEFAHGYTAVAIKATARPAAYQKFLDGMAADLGLNFKAGNNLRFRPAYEKTLDETFGGTVASCCGGGGKASKPPPWQVEVNAKDAIAIYPRKTVVPACDGDLPIQFAAFVKSSNASGELAVADWKIFWKDPQGGSHALTATWKDKYLLSLTPNQMLQHMPPRSELRGTSVERLAGHQFTISAHSLVHNSHKEEDKRAYDHIGRGYGKASATLSFETFELNQLKTWILCNKAGGTIDVKPHIKGDPTSGRLYTWTVVEDKSTYDHKGQTLSNPGRKDPGLAMPTVDADGILSVQGRSPGSYKVVISLANATSASCKLEVPFHLIGIVSQCPAGNFKDAFLLGEGLPANEKVSFFDQIDQGRSYYEARGIFYLPLSKVGDNYFDAQRRHFPKLDPGANDNGVLSFTHLKKGSYKHNTGQIFKAAGTITPWTGLSAYQPSPCTWEPSIEVFHLGSLDCLKVACNDRTVDIFQSLDFFLGRSLTTFNPRLNLHTFDSAAGLKLDDPTQGQITALGTLNPGDYKITAELIITTCSGLQTASRDITLRKLGFLQKSLAFIDDAESTPSPTMTLGYDHAVAAYSLHGDQQDYAGVDIVVTRDEKGTPVEIYKSRPSLPDAQMKGELKWNGRWHDQINYVSPGKGPYTVTLRYRPRDCSGTASRNTCDHDLPEFIPTACAVIVWDKGLYGGEARRVKVRASLDKAGYDQQFVGFGKQGVLELKAGMKNKPLLMFIYAHGNPVRGRPDEVPPVLPDFRLKFDRGADGLFSSSELPAPKVCRPGFCVLNACGGADPIAGFSLEYSEKMANYQLLAWKWCQLEGVTDKVTDNFFKALEGDRNFDYDEVQSWRGSATHTAELSLVDETGIPSTFDTDFQSFYLR